MDELEVLVDEVVVVGCTVTVVDSDTFKAGGRVVDGCDRLCAAIGMVEGTKFGVSVDEWVAAEKLVVKIVDGSAGKSIIVLGMGVVVVVVVVGGIE